MSNIMTSEEFNRFLKKRSSKKRSPKKRKLDISPKEIEKQFLQLCVDEGLPLPQPEYLFAKQALQRQWRIDYYFEKGGIKVGLEVEGGIHTGGRHTRGAGFARDMEKYNAMATLGIYLLRVVPDDLLTINTIELIKKVLG